MTPSLRQVRRYVSGIIIVHHAGCQESLFRKLKLVITRYIDQLHLCHIKITSTKNIDHDDYPTNKFLREL